MQAAANLTLLYHRLPWEERFQAAANDGFSAVEILFPYDHPPSWYAQRLREADLRLSLINTPTEPDAFPLGMAADPAAIEIFRANFRQALDVCNETGCEAIHVMAGNRNPAYARDEHMHTLAGNLQWAASCAGFIKLHLEALNQVDMPDYLYSVPDDVLAVLAEAALPNAGLQYDFYHVVKQNLDVMATLRDCRPHISHVQVAGTPLRHEPDLSKHELAAGFDFLCMTGYTGVVGFEYRAAGDVAEGLAWTRGLGDGLDLSSGGRDR